MINTCTDRPSFRSVAKSLATARRAAAIAIHLPASQVKNLLPSTYSLPLEMNFAIKLAEWEDENQMLGFATISSLDNGSISATTISQLMNIE